MTEDDTFLILSRPSIPEMLQHYNDWIENKNGQFEGLQEMCKRHGWDWAEFSVAAGIWKEKHGIK